MSNVMFMVLLNDNGILGKCTYHHKDFGKIKPESIYTLLHLTELQQALILRMYSMNGTSQGWW